MRACLHVHESLKEKKEDGGGRRGGADGGRGDHGDAKEGKKIAEEKKEPHKFLPLHERER